MENNKKGEVVESKGRGVFFNSRATGCGTLPWEGFPSGEKEATGPCSGLSWWLEVGTPEMSMLLLVTSSSCLSPQSTPLFHQCNHISADICAQITPGSGGWACPPLWSPSWGTLCWRLGGHRARPCPRRSCSHTSSSPPHQECKPWR